MLQLSIAARGLARVKVGGMMVYSTCSFNPAENEAVVAALLRNHAGIVELVDVSDRLPKLKRRPGMYTWPVVDKDLNLLTRDDPGVRGIVVPFAHDPPLCVFIVNS